MTKKDIKDFSLEEIKKICDKKWPAYRAGQIYFWLYNKNVKSFDEMNNIPKDLRNELEKNYFIGAIELVKHSRSKDKTEKFLFKLTDNNFIETVLIQSRDRKTICISTQVGCKFACSFCSSGLKGFIRNLTPSEILNQILYLTHVLNQDITNYVFMGIGEPLDNYENLIKSISIMNDPGGMKIGARRITISTCGIVPGIERLKSFKPQVNLSISLHAANDKLRNKLIPINKRYPLRELVNACKDFIEEKGRMITLEYVLIKNINDSLKDAGELVLIAKKLRAKVNLIPYSPSKHFNLKPTDKNYMEMFLKQLESEKVHVTLRESKGQDIEAACGQLRGNFE